MVPPSICPAPKQNDKIVLLCLDVFIAVRVYLKAIESLFALPVGPYRRHAACHFIIARWIMQLQIKYS